MATAPLVVALGLAVFWGVSLQNVLRHKGTSVRGQGETPVSLWFILVLFGSLLLFAESLAFIALEYSGIGFRLGVFQVAGLVLYLAGCMLHGWSVIVRGQHATSWSMHDDHRLVTVAPYSFVRHPSYLGYLLMIIGFTFVWAQWFTFLPWAAIPGYVMVSRQEEQLLLNKFGEQYQLYMNKVGAFIPKR